MKTSVAISLIVSGVLLILTPPISAYLHQRSMVELLLQDGTRQVHLAGGLSETYSLGCWAVGSMMIGVAILGTFRERREKAPNAEAVLST